MDLLTSKAEQDSEAVFICGVFNQNLSFSVWSFQLCVSAIDKPEARRPACGHSELPERAGGFYSTHALVEGFPDVPTSPLLTQILEQTEVA